MFCFHVKSYDLQYTVHCTPSCLMDLPFTPLSYSRLNAQHQSLPHSRPKTIILRIGRNGQSIPRPTAASRVRGIVAMTGPGPSVLRSVRVSGHKTEEPRSRAATAGGSQRAGGRTGSSLGVFEAERFGGLRIGVGLEIRARAWGTTTGRAAQKESDQNNQSNEHLDCLPGRISLDLLLLLTHPGGAYGYTSRRVRCCLQPRTI